MSPEALPTPSASSEAGFTLVEIVISVLLTAVMAAGVLGLALTATKGSGRSDHKTECAQLTRQVSAQLKTFVTGYYDYATGTFEPTAAKRTIAAPNGGTTAADWAWSAYTGADGATIADSAGAGVYALSAGTHILTAGIVPAQYNASTPYNMSVTYVVTVPANDVGGGVNGRLRAPKVDITCNWTEPQ